MARRHENLVLYDTFTSFLNNCLLSDKSLLWSDKNYWTLENLLALKKHVVDAPEFGKTLSFEEKLERPLFMTNIPSFALKLALGEMSKIILEGSKISSNKLIDSGYAFSFPTLDKALSNLLLKNK